MGERDLEEVLRSLDGQERAVFEYFRRNISVGEILAVKELKLLHKLEDPVKVIDSLIRKGVLEKAPGCINLSKRVRELLKKRP